MTIAAILGVRSEGDTEAVVFQFVRDDGHVEGPRVEYRPKGEDHQAFIDAQIEAIDASLDRVEPTEQERLAEALREFSDASVKEVTGLDDEKVRQIKIEGKVALLEVEKDIEELKL